MSDNVCVVFYSRTGNTAAVADDIATAFDEPTVHRIVPRTDRSYPNWLARSFVPGSTVPICSVETDLRGYDAVFLGTPKWTLSCPPFTEYLTRVTLDGTRAGLFVTYGGFDEQRYTRRLAGRLRELGATVPATLRVQRDSIGTPEYERGVRRFCDQVASGSGNEGE